MCRWMVLSLLPLEGPAGLAWISLSPDLFEYVEQRIQQTDTALYGRTTLPDDGVVLAKLLPIILTPARMTMRIRVGINLPTKVVLSKTLLQKNHPDTQIISSHLSDEIHKLKHNAGSEILLFGSPSATHALMSENLIDEYWLFVNPISAGARHSLVQKHKRQNLTHAGE
ncbi:RibD C-terminal domain [Raoultella planticola]|uniref:RibD C-terminal domain n=1 Tax=Raoultella planticola TaxID=575 RepID=A0A485D7N3_RAOPL|nr:RibD C-terminal domain [Raoultella planticola]